MKIQCLSDEYWYGDCVKYGVKMPLSPMRESKLDLTINTTPNQASPVFLSSRGRVLFRKEGFPFILKDGEIEVPSDCILTDTKGRLKEAYQFAIREYSPFHKNMPNQKLFRHIQYNTWIELTFYQSEEAVLQYAERLLTDGFEPGILMIDDGWSEYYGEWSFHSGRFRNPKGMIAKLHEMGFQVMLWLCPFISPDSIRYRECRDLGLLIKTPQGEPFITDWWNGHSAVLDMTNENAKQWLKQQLTALTKLGVDGFKFDAGDPIYYRTDNVTFRPTSPNEQSYLWSKFGEDYEYNEYRASFGTAGFGLLQRLCDKEHSFGEHGIASLIPDALLAGLLGFPYICPDMIGGGEYLSFQDKEKLDEELFVTHAQIACLMPAMQFSALPGRVLSKENLQAIYHSLRVRQTYLPYILELVEQVPQSGEPVLRYMAYEFPDEHLETVTDQFMLGSRYLVAPLYRKGECSRDVYIPKGEWRCGAEVICSEGEVRKLRAERGIPLILEKISSM
ncbi:MAG: glycoside hydrolase family 31 protein [Lachnospiraceae bacterium]|nr:glycoside hydrolase family 31 protein [Lachnospiraceae bacterium]MDY5742966.1 glycoside hydrolase family 31 protein [Lachnospiraceae bacterium]